MPHFGAISRRELIRCLRQFGFTAPKPGGSHEYVTKGALRVRIPNPHGGEIDVFLLARILRQAGIPREEWEEL